MKKIKDIMRIAYEVVLTAMSGWWAGFVVWYIIDDFDYVIHRSGLLDKLLYVWVIVVGGALFYYGVKDLIKWVKRKLYKGKRVAA